MHAFENTVKTLREKREFFSPDGPIHIGRAPGRLDLIGGNVDYTGGLVFEMTIQEATWAAAQPRKDGLIVFLNPQMKDHGWDTRVEFKLADLGSEDNVRRLVNQSPEIRWTSYLLGIFYLLKNKFPDRIQTGANVYIESEVPLNKGVSSSAAVEIAVMKTVAQAYGISYEGIELAQACQWVENVIAQSACGIMDQAIIVMGHEGSCLPLLCKPCEPHPPVRLPSDLAVWAIDSGVRHAVTGIEYEAARAACFMGYKMICDWEKLNLRLDDSNDIPRWVDSRWDGYPSNISPSQFRSLYERRLPEEWTGEEYLKSSKLHIDPFTPVRPEAKYPIRAATRYAVEENQRVCLFAELARGNGQQNSTEAFRLMGDLMYQSHFAYTECGLGAKATDLIVDLARQEGIAQGIYGSKITGGGSGGTVAILGHRDAREAFLRVVRGYKEIQGFDPYVFEGSSMGADDFGVIQA
ncbi:MAG TPA: galactokinase family protein [Terriglobia bacterium]|nr:galactokinase family protein [Terriglobia bacterium]